MSARVRLLAIAAAAVAALAWRAAPAAAQGVSCAGGTIEPIEVLLPDDDGEGFVQKSDPDEVDFFNAANCACATPFAVQLQLTGGVPSMTDVGEVWAGIDCATAIDQVAREEQCYLETTFADIVSDLQSQQDQPIDTRLMMFADGVCAAETGTRGVWLLDDDNNPNDNVWDCNAAVEIAIDTEPPPLAGDPEVLAGEGAAVVEWTPPTSRGEDVQFYQVLCARAGGADPADDFPRDDAEYQTAHDVCGADDGVTLQDLSGGGDADAGAGGTPFDDLDAATVCGTATGTETSIQVTGLQNGVAYHVALLSVDDARNVSGAYLGQVTPQPVKDFWEDYHDKGGNADGGLCLGVTTGGGDAPLGDVLVVLAAVLLTLLPWRARRRLAAGAGLLAVVLGATAARAQGYDPYWERWDDEAETSEETIPHWNFSFKAGPYRPAVDDEFDLPAGQTPPFEAMFGADDNFFGVIDLERYFLFPAGQLGAYASIGLTSQRADAFQVDGAGNVLTDDEGRPLRARGNRVIFRLVPMSLGAVYRLTALDDQWKVPLVPYGKLGLTYGLWWVRAPDGSFAQAPTPDCMDPETGGCDGDRALGASLGWQATVGLAIRAERLDPQSATNLREEMGIEHAGFFAELMYAKIDHFGSDTRLNVGDTTWLAGINFEF